MTEAEESKFIEENQLTQQSLIKSNDITQIMSFSLPHNLYKSENSGDLIKLLKLTAESEDGKYVRAIDWSEGNVMTLNSIYLLQKFKRLHELKVNWDGIEDNHVEQILISCKSLNSLSIKNGYNLTDKSVELIAVTLKDRLVKLDLSLSKKAVLFSLITHSSMTLLTENCQNLTHLNVSNRQMPDIWLGDLRENCQELKELILANYEIGVNGWDALQSTIGQADDSLRKLDISETKCNDKKLKKILKANIKLKEINLQKCENISKKSNSLIIKYSKSIEVVKTDLHNLSFKIIKKVKNLKEIEILDQKGDFCRKFKEKERFLVRRYKKRIKAIERNGNLITLYLNP